MRSNIKLTFLCLFLLQITEVWSQETTSPPNVLFICIDDLRPELGCYGNSVVQSPNLDKLASQSHLFTNHFVTVPTCGASRYGLLTGLYPRTKTAVSNDAIRKLIAEKPEEDRPETFIAKLRRDGYYTVGIGKISHYVDGLLYGYTDPVGTEWEMPDSWDEMLFDAGKWGTGWNAFFGYADGSNRQGKNKQVKPYEAADVADTDYPDGLTTELAVKKLQEFATRDEPFFLGVGFFKPHLPFNAPKKYWDMYDRTDILLTNSPDIPANVHPASLHNNGEFNQYQLGDESATLEQPVSDEYARKLKHGYYASISYIDAQVGKVLDELARLGLDENTIVVVWGDHGWHLGDDRIWGKHTNFEYALRSAFMIKTPDSQGKQHDEIVSTVDIYPTLMELCKMKASKSVDGSSLVNVMSDANADWRNTAYSYFRQGITVRTDQYRLTKYFREEQPITELYNHQSDPYENENIADQSPDLVESLLLVWEEGNTGLFKEP
ncbi:sulfatase [Tunicatimonas pelagia]|uniref:sulfatase n=1 Tax=Tunicatimonas pelagia TaxID=931531 RepID=UPI002665DB39|nr:sulfatase [Tunicatimonas pelagia]WKN41796.1 sulfatase [Tunicatimonas pelagia]